MPNPSINERVQTRRPPKGQVSLLRVLLLLIPALALLCTILVLWILRPHEEPPLPPQSACIANLWPILGVKDAWALDHKKLPTDVPTDADLSGKDRYIAEKRPCPTGGTYTLGAVREKPTCSIPGHALPENPGL